MKDSKSQMVKRNFTRLPFRGRTTPAVFDLVLRLRPQYLVNLKTLTLQANYNTVFATSTYGSTVTTTNKYYFNHGTTDTWTKIETFVSALEDFMGQSGNEEIIIA